MLFPRWLRDRLAVTPVVYRQQKIMYGNDTHTCENRIVSRSSLTCVRFSGANVQTPPNSARNCTFP